MSLRLISALCLAALSGICQPSLKSLEALTGDWKGSGWIQMGGPERQEFTGTEKVYTRWDGKLIVIEGRHFAKADASKPIHEAMAMLSWDSRANEPRMYACTATQGCRAADAKLTEKGFEWGFKLPSGTVRYIIDLSTAGVWVETGEFSADGSTWRKFFEMKMEKSK